MDALAILNHPEWLRRRFSWNGSATFSRYLDLRFIRSQEPTYLLDACAAHEFPQGRAPGWKVCDAKKVVFFSETTFGADFKSALYVS